MVFAGRPQVRKPKNSAGRKPMNAQEIAQLIDGIVMGDQAAIKSQLAAKL